MNTKLILSLISFVVLGILLVNSVYALGVTPARTSIDFSPSMEKEVSFSIINSEHKDLKFVVYTQGELNYTVSLSETSFEMKAGEENRQLKYNVKLPSSLSPGVHSVDVIVLQLPDKSESSQTYVGAAIGVTTQLYVYVPYPGKYLEAGFNVVNAEQGGKATFVIPVVNRGNLNIANAYANIDIYNKLNEKVASFNTPEIEIDAGDRREIVTEWKADSPVGNYRAVATIIYDGVTTMIERQFSIGSSVLDLQEVKVRDFRLGEIARFEMLIENKWSEPILGAYAQTQVFDSEGKVMADFKSPTYDIQPLAKTVMTSYWDTVGVGSGSYDSSVYLKYGEKSAQKDFKFKVSDTNIEVIGLGYVISESRGSKSGENSSLVIILVIVIGVLVLINLVWFLVVRKKLSGR